MTLNSDSTEIFELLSLGLSDKKSSFSVLTSNRYFDKNIVGIIRNFLLTGFYIDSLSRPKAVLFVPQKKQIYFNDGDVIKIFSANGKKFLGEFGSHGTEQLQFDRLRAMALSSAQNIYIADMLNSRIQIVSLDGKFISEFGSDILKAPLDVIWDKTTGFVFVADIDRKGIFAFDANGIFQFSFPIESPSHLDSDGKELFVANIIGYQISVFSVLDGKFIRKFILGDDGEHDDDICVYDIVLHPSRPELIVINRDNSIRLYDIHTGTLLKKIVNNNDYGFNYFEGCSIDPENGAIYVCDSRCDGGRVYCFYGI